MMWMEIQEITTKRAVIKSLDKACNGPLSFAFPPAHPPDSVILQYALLKQASSSDINVLCSDTVKRSEMQSRLNSLKNVLRVAENHENAARGNAPNTNINKR